MQLVRSFRGLDGADVQAWSVDGVADKLRLMRDLIDGENGRRAYNVHARAARIVTEAGAPARDQVAQARAIGDWVWRRGYYLPEGGELFRTARRQLAELPTGGALVGDCDCFTILIAALCESIGIRCDPVAMAWWGKFCLHGRCVPASRLIQRLGRGRELPAPPWRHVYPRALFTREGELRELPLDAATERRPGFDPVRVVEAQTGEAPQLLTC